MSEGVTSGSSLEAEAPADVIVSRAFLEVSDTTGIVDFARGLAGLGIEVLAVGETAAAIGAAGVDVDAIGDLADFAGVLDGNGSALPVDLVCINLHPIERTAARRGVQDSEVIDLIDIGGPTLIRAAAKNRATAAPVVSPASYDAVLEELRSSDRRLSMATREALAAEAFAYSARYDTAIARWFQERQETFPPLIVRAYERELELPHGENPHQRAAYYAQIGVRTHLMSMIGQLGGDELSFNDLLDLDVGRSVLDEFLIPACVITRHGTVSAVAVGSDVSEAFARARAADAGDARSGVACLGGSVDELVADAIAATGLEVVFARGYDEDALDSLLETGTMRVLDNQEKRATDRLAQVQRQVRGGLLVQDSDADLEERMELQVVSERRPTEAEWQALTFAWKICKHERSGAIVFASEVATVGIGAGQANRLEAVRTAIASATDSLDGCVMASDGAFASVAGPQLAIDAGITAMIQPAGADGEPAVVMAADEAGIAMVLSTRRHLRH